MLTFEPAPHTASRLIANATLNDVDVQVVTAALGETDGIARLSIVTRGNNGLSSLRPWPDVTYEGTILCPCARTDSLLTTGALPAPTVVKLDVEGFEVVVLRGFGDLLSSNELRSIVFESPADLIKDPESQPVFTMLTKAGFEITPLAPAHASEKRVANNFLATRR